MLNNTRIWLIAALLAAAPLAAGAQVKAPPAEGEETETQAAAPDMSPEEKARIQKEIEAEERRRMAAERAAEDKARREALFEKCVIRPVMTDDEIEACRLAYRQ
jgi:hypothetical protein